MGISAFIHLALKEGIENNLVVFDVDARKGQLSTRLFQHMVDVLKNNPHLFKGTPIGDYQVYIPEEVLLRAVKRNVVEFPFSQHYIGCTPEALTKLYTKLGGSLPRGTKSLVLLVGTKGQVLLGAF